MYLQRFILLFFLGILLDLNLIQACVGNKNQRQCKPVSSSRLQGTIAPVITPFDKNGTLNIDVIPEYANFLAKNGIKVIYVNGPDEGGYIISLSERQKLLNAWLQACKPLGIAVMVDLSGLPYSEVILLAKYAKEAGVDAVSASLDLYYKPKVMTDAVDYLNGIAQNVKPIPLYYNDRRFQTTNLLNMGKLITEASKKIVNFVGVITTLSIGLLASSKMSSNQSVFVYGSTYMPSVYAYCLDGTINPLNNIFPNATVEIENSNRNGDNLKSISCQLNLNEIFASIIDVLDLDMLAGFHIPHLNLFLREVFMMVNNIDVGFAPTPLKAISEAEKAKLVQILQNAGLLDQNN